MLSLEVFTHCQWTYYYSKECSSFVIVITFTRYLKRNLIHLLKIRYDSSCFIYVLLKLASTPRGDILNTRYFTIITKSGFRMIRLKEKTRLTSKLWWGISAQVKKIYLYSTFPDKLYLLLAIWVSAANSTSVVQW